MADVILSPFFLCIIVSLQERGSTLSIHYSPKEEEEKKAPKPSIFTTKIFIFSPPFLHFFFFFSQNKIFQGTDE